MEKGNDSSKKDVLSSRRDFFKTTGQAMAASAFA